MPRKRMENVVVLLPGITGSVLRRGNKDVWAPSAGAVLNALRSFGDSIRGLELTEDPLDVDVLDDGVTATRIMPDIHLIPELWKIDGYSKIGRWIGETFDVEKNVNYFEFAYDWRRDNRVAARILARESEKWLAAWRRRSGNDDAKLILVGHSMGGLIARYFLECLEGWRSTSALVTFGTPFRGSLNALGFVANGFEKRLGPFTFDLSKLLRSFTSIYQLLPIYPCCDDGGGDLVRPTEAQVPNLDPERAKAGLKFHDEISEALERNRDLDEYRRDQYVIHTVIGTFQPTKQSAALRNGRLELARSHGGTDQDGDGTVPRVSASPREYDREQGAMYAAEQHASLQNDDAVLVQLAGVLTSPGLDLSQFRAFPTIALGLAVDDVYSTEEPVIVRIRPEERVRHELLAVVADAEQGFEVARAPLRRAGDDTHEAELPPLPQGAYRVSVIGSGFVEPVSDVFVVVEEGGSG